jgi:hypothetical protein
MWILWRIYYFIFRFFENCGILWIFGYYLRILWNIVEVGGDFLKTENGKIVDFWNNLVFVEAWEILILIFEFYEN